MLFEKQSMYNANDGCGNQTRQPAEFRFDSHLGTLASDVSRGPEVFSMTRSIVIRQGYNLAYQFSDFPINLLDKKLILLAYEYSEMWL